jgi:hypothetical protein
MATLAFMSLDGERAISAFFLALCVLLIGAQIFFRLRAIRRDKAAAAVIGQSLSSHRMQQAK